MTDTIFALATPPGTSAIAVIRVSGPGADEALGQLIAGPLPRHRVASQRWLHGADGTRLDEALVLRFVAPASATGETVVEFHCHGGRAVVAAVLRALAAIPGLRPAEAGEFTQRAFRNGRLDLTQVEGLGDLLAAETEGQRRQAIGGLSGALRARAEDWRSRLLEALAMTEVTIDWADEEVPEDVGPEVRATLASLAAEIATLLEGQAAAERLREGFTVVLIGAPNAGKSSLLNALVRRPLAIATPTPGTTRDLIEGSLEIDGLAVTLVDTAGLATRPDDIEAIGIDRARDRAAAADLRLFLHAPDAPLPADAEALRRSGDLDIATKADRNGATTKLDHRVSIKDAASIDALRTHLGALLADRTAGASLVSHVRQARHLTAAARHLTTAADTALCGEAEIMAEEMRLAVRALEELTGRIDTEAVLDRVFSAFCLGK
ncbi:MAG: tRNA uridine-5-carboxymethylaminomethyl(34) synthesis GTPase MnmE [Pseudomonadota bacterium]